MASTIGSRLRKLRYDQGLSQRDLSDRENRVTYAYISRIEAGKRNPSVRALRVLAEKLGVTVAYLETGYEGLFCPYCGEPADSYSNVVDCKKCEIVVQLKAVT